MRIASGEVGRMPIRILGHCSASVGLTDVGIGVGSSAVTAIPKTLSIQLFCEQAVKGPNPHWVTSGDIPVAGLLHFELCQGLSRLLQLQAPGRRPSYLPSSTLSISQVRHFREYILVKFDL